MGFRSGTRINLGKGLSLNVGKSGIYPSLKTKRTKGGTISTKEFSVKTGISGVGYRKSFKISRMPDLNSCRFNCCNGNRI